MLEKKREMFMAWERVTGVSWLRYKELEHTVDK